MTSVKTNIRSNLLFAVEYSKLVILFFRYCFRIGLVYAVSTHIPHWQTLLVLGVFISTKSNFVLLFTCGISLNFFRFEHLIVFLSACVFAYFSPFRVNKSEVRMSLTATVISVFAYGLFPSFHYVMIMFKMYSMFVSTVYDIQTAPQTPNAVYNLLADLFVFPTRILSEFVN